jgi:membrane protein DedA with SNARE-associated domain
MIDAALAFTCEHRDWVFLVAFLLALAETLLVVSVFVPSTPILVGIGGLVATGTLDFAPLFAGAALGSVAGSLVSWGIGRHYGPDLLRTRLMRRRARRVRQVRRAFERWGAAAVVVGHLFGPFRTLTFALAGLTAMPLVRFLPTTALGSAIWAYVTPKAGELGGLALGALF